MDKRPAILSQDADLLRRTLLSRPVASPGRVPATHRGKGSFPTILVGAGDRAVAAAAEVVAACNGFAVLGLVAEPGEARSHRLAEYPVLGRPADLPRLVRDLGARAVVVAQEGPIAAELAPLLLSCGMAGARVMDVPRLFEHLSGRVPLDHVEEGWLLSQVFSASRSARYYVGKRLVDVIVSSVALAVFGLLLPVIALAIRVSSGGRVFFKQERVGFRGKPFHVFKLRSMIEGAEETGVPVWAEPDDQRVTRVGRFLRRTRLDEVPQFWNVLRGEMSVVGPRPERPYFVEELRREIRHYEWRHLVLPGITGWAQVSQGYAASVVDSFRKLELDLYYIKNRSLSLDLKILARTVGVVLGRRGAR